jgi:hypothetical protein
MIAIAFNQRTTRINALNGKAVLLGGILFFAIGTVLVAQETSLEQVPGLRERALIMHVISRIVEQDQEIVWNSENTNITMPGRPVGLKLVGAELVVAVQFTPFLRPNGQHTLVAQSQVWVNVPGEGMSFQTAMQTIPLEFGELVYFFPLGSMRSQETAHIEIQLVLEPYANGTRTRQNREENAPSPNTGRGGARANPR